MYPCDYLPAHLLVGSIFSVQIWPSLPFRHKVIFVGFGAGGHAYVVSAIPELVALVRWDKFTLGRDWIDEGYPSNLPSQVVVRRAISMIGHPYSFWSFNCEHLTNYCHGLDVTSNQADLAKAMLFGAALAVLATRG